MNQNTHLFTNQLFEYFNEKVPYAVLRNYEGLPDNNTSRDIDIAIKKDDYYRIRKDLIGIIEGNDWKIITYLNSDRLITWVCGHIDEGGNTEIIQFDFFFHTSVYGIKLLTSEEIIALRMFNGKVYHSNPDYEFLDKYLYDRAVGAKYPEKYKSVKNVAEQSAFVAQTINRTFGVDNVQQCDNTSSRKMLLHALRKNMYRHPICTLWSMMFFLYTFVRNYVLSRTGFSIGFTGPDGSGKTTVIELLKEELGAVFKTAHAYYHFRPTLFGNISDVAHSAGLKKEVDKNYDQPHRGSKTGKLSSLLRLGYYTMDYILGYFLKVKSLTRITKFVIFDRYYTDIICDSRRSRINLSPKFLYFFGKCFIPNLDYNILLTASTETIRSRKAELDEEGIENINKTIDFLSTKKNYLKVMNEGEPMEAVREIINHIVEKQHRKNIKRLS